MPFKNYSGFSSSLRKMPAAIEIRIGTRGSQLALRQTNHVKAGLEERFPDISITVQTIKTTGDKILDAPLAKIGDQGLFTKELELALLDGRIDCAVHSLKDIPTTIHEGLAIAAVLEREDVHDVFIAHPKRPYRHLNDVPPGAALLTGSLRRKCQLLSARPDLHIIDVRGNLNSRMRKLEESNWDGMILAQAGVKRLGWAENITEILPFEFMLPAVGQGALAVEARLGDGRIAEMLRVLHHTPTAIATSAERALLRRLEGGCQIPIGAYGQIREDGIRIDAVIGSLDGKRVVRGTKGGPVAEAEKVGIELAEELMRLGGKEILEEIRSSTRT
jgi:hydroxymethylbilane synthase